MKRENLNKKPIGPQLRGLPLEEISAWVACQRRSAYGWKGKHLRGLGWGFGGQLIGEPLWFDNL